MTPLVALRGAFVLLLVMGVSGTLVGLMIGQAILGQTVPVSGVAIPLGFVAYGLALIAAAIGLLLGRRWAWPLGVGAIVLGLAVLVVILVTVGRMDLIIGSGVLIWAVALGLLLIGAPARVR